ncbi:MAG: hypothetical protein V3S43_06405 [Acidimicrobiia bacterium]
MAQRLPIDNQRDEVRGTLQGLEAVGGAPPNDPTAVSMREAIDIFWRGANVKERAEITALYRRAYRLEGTEEGRSLLRPAFRSLVDGGWFGELLDYTEPGKSTPQFYFASALAYIAAGFGNEPIIEWQAITLYPNMYVLIVGDAGSGKGAAINKVKPIVCDAMGPNVLPNEGSHQGFADCLMRRGLEMGTHADGLIVAEEFKVLISDDRHKTQLVTWLTEWYQYDGVWRRALKGNKGKEYAIPTPIVSLLGASNLAWLKKIPGDAILGGFLPRFLIFDTPPHEEKWGDAFPEFDSGAPEELRRPLEQALERVKPLMKVSVEAIAWLRGWHLGEHKDRYKQQSDDQVQKAFQRKQATLMKLAAIWQLVDGGPADELQVEWVQRAIKVVNWCDTSMQRVYGQLGVTREGEALSDVLDLLGRKGKMRQVSIARQLRNRHKAPRVYEALDALKEQGDATMTSDVESGRVWELIDRGERGSP